MMRRDIRTLSLLALKYDMDEKVVKDKIKSVRSYFHRDSSVFVAANQEVLCRTLMNPADSPADRCLLFWRGMLRDKERRKRLWEKLPC